MTKALTDHDFASSADPHSWLLVADNLYKQAVFLYRQNGGGRLIRRDGSGSVLGQWPDSNRATFLLAGFAIENAIKAFLVYENPHWISNGVLARPLRSHRLVELSEKSKLIPWPTRGKVVLRQFERGIESWARYPCGLSAVETEAEQNLTDHLWRNYLSLMRAYGKRLRSLLEHDWKGPHGTGGYFQFGWGHLGARFPS